MTTALTIGSLNVCCGDRKGWRVAKEYAGGERQNGDAARCRGEQAVRGDG
jgi:hypothetical protein